MKQIIFSFGGGLTSFFGGIKAIEDYGFNNVDFVNAALEDDERHVRPVMDAFTAHTGKSITRITLTNPALDSVRVMLNELENGRMSPVLMRWLLSALKQQKRAHSGVSECKEPRYSVWHIFFYGGRMGSTLADPCSDQLKRSTLRRWVQTHYEPDQAIIAVGMYDDEIDRHLRTRKIWRARGYDVVSPLMGQAWNKEQRLAEFEVITGFKPEAYDLGLDHNNCELCVKGGLEFFARCLYYRRPFYVRWARLEQLHQQVYQHHNTILRDQSGGYVSPRTMLDFQQEMEKRWANMNVLPGMEDLMFFGLEKTPACRFCEAAA